MSSYLTGRFFGLRLMGLDYKLPIMKFGDCKATPVLDVFDLPPKVVSDIAKVICRNVEDSGDLEVVVAPEARGLPLATLVALELGLPLVVLRKVEHNYMDERRLSTSTISVDSRTGMKLVMAGHYRSLLHGVRAMIVDDSIVTGETLEAIRSILSEVGAVISKISVVTLASGIVEGKVDYLVKLPVYSL